MLRILGAILLAGLMTGGAQASSFVTVAAPTNPISTSFVVVGAPTSFAKVDEIETSALGGSASLIPLAYPLPDGKPARAVQISPSVVAFESQMPAIGYEMVASVGSNPSALRPTRLWTPMVMRGGIIGDGSATAIAPVVASQAPASSPTKKSRVGGKSGGAPVDEAPKPVVVAPPPPNMPRLEGPK